MLERIKKDERVTWIAKAIAFGFQKCLVFRINLKNDSLNSNGGGSKSIEKRGRFARWFSNAIVLGIPTVIFLFSFLVDLLFPARVIHILLLLEFLVVFSLLYLQNKSAPQRILTVGFGIIFQAIWAAMSSREFELFWFAIAVSGFIYLIPHAAKVLALEEARRVPSEAKGTDDRTSQEDLPKTKDQTGKRGGRPRDPADEWAREQVHVLGRNRDEVEKEWLVRIGERAKVLADPHDSFDKVIRKKPKKGE